LKPPTKADLDILDPDGRFRVRLEADRRRLAELSDDGDRNELRRVVHGLAGAAGTFGYREIGDAAIALDDKFAAGERVLPVDIARLVAALEQALGKPEKSA
jgi:HPt (histidine-containing phosphotransfer) domain-containing protein